MLLERVSGLLARSGRWLLACVAVLALVWVVFFDSHSILTRVQLQAERSRLLADNEALKERIDELEETLSKPLTAAEVERVAREDFDMSKDGETVFLVIED